MIETVSIDSDEEEDDKTKKGVRSAFNKKIKKERKAPKKIVYQNDEYIVDNWIECEKCKTWRIVKGGKKVVKGFTCKSMKKRCRSKENVPKNIFVIN